MHADVGTLSFCYMIIIHRFHTHRGDIFELHQIFRKNETSIEHEPLGLSLLTAALFLGLYTTRACYLSVRWGSDAIKRPTLLNPINGITPGEVFCLQPGQKEDENT